MVPLDSLNDAHAHREMGHLRTSTARATTADDKFKALSLVLWTQTSPTHQVSPWGSVGNSGTAHRRTTHSHTGITHNRTSPLSRLHAHSNDRLKCSRAAQDTPSTQTAAKNRGTTDYLTPHPETRPIGTALDILVRGHLKHEDQMGCGGWVYNDLRMRMRMSFNQMNKISCNVAESLPIKVNIDG